MNLRERSRQRAAGILLLCAFFAYGVIVAPPDRCRQHDGSFTRSTRPTCCGLHTDGEQFGNCDRDRPALEGHGAERRRKDRQHLGGCARN
jgi:hypothetical protein